MIELRNIYYPTTSDDTIGQLYLWLAQRTPEQAISHKRMPTLTEHRKFVDSGPYEAWYFIVADESEGSCNVGAIYLTRKREVGIHVDSAKRGKGYGSEALKELLKHHPGPLLANINPENERSIAFFKKHGAKLIQHTYEL